MSASALWYAGLPDGVTDVLVGPQGGLFVAGFDSLKRRCLVLYAPPFGLPLRTVSTLPYRDFGRSAPTVLAARDPTRDRLYVLLYQQPDNLGLSQTSLYRVDPGSGERTLLAADSSPRWAPAAVLPRAGSVLVALRGLGPMLEYRACGEAACLAAMPVGSAASNASGKAGLAELAGRLLLVVGSDPIYATGGAVVCERRDGSLQPLLPPPPPGASPWGRPAGGRAGGERRAAHARAAGGAPGRPTHRGRATLDARSPTSRPGATHPAIANPDKIVVAADGSLYVVTRQLVNEYGYAHGSVLLLERQARACAHGLPARPCTPLLPARQPCIFLARTLVVLSGCSVSPDAAGG